MWAKVCPLFGPPDPAGIKANESITKGGGVLMSKIFMYVNKLLVKATGHRYTGFTVKMPFINLSFAPAQRYSSQRSCFFVIRPSIG